MHKMVQMFMDNSNITPKRARCLCYFIQLFHVVDKYLLLVIIFKMFALYFISVLFATLSLGHETEGRQFFLKTGCSK